MEEQELERQNHYVNNNSTTDITSHECRVWIAVIFYTTIQFNAACRTRKLRNGISPEKRLDKISTTLNTGFFFEENVRYPLWICRDPISLILGTR